MYDVSWSGSSSLASSSDKPAAGGKRKSATGREEQPKAKKTKEQPAAGGKEQPKEEKTKGSGATGGKEKPKMTTDSKATGAKSAEKPATGGIVNIRRSVGSATQRPPKTKQEAATLSKATGTAMEKPLTQKPATGGNTSSYYSDDDYYQDESASSAEPPIASPATQKQEDQASVGSAPNKPHPLANGPTVVCELSWRQLVPGHGQLEHV